LARDTETPGISAVSSTVGYGVVMVMGWPTKVSSVNISRPKVAIGFHGV